MTKACSKCLVVPVGMLMIPTGATLGLHLALFCVTRLWHRETARILMAGCARLRLQEDMYEDLDATLRDLASPAHGRVGLPAEHRWKSEGCTFFTLSVCHRKGRMIV